MINEKVAIPLFFIVLIILMGSFTSLFSEINTLVTGKTITNHPPAVILINPNEGEVLNTNEPILKWQYSDLDNDPQTMGLIQLSLDLRFENAQNTYFVGSSKSKKLQKLEDTTYYWRMKVKDSSDWSEWSEIQRFAVDSSKKACSDGTLFYQCSTTKPLYCNGGLLVNNCLECSCFEGYSCQEDNSCKKIPLELSEQITPTEQEQIQIEETLPITTSKKPTFFQKIINFFIKIFTFR